ncbi:MAG: 2-C-methyl-D-erythritol 4-phosphate cytidylyltransferase [Bacteroidaceae bacterium]|nr:2-C-methyl-D-erythritol 4-phosphate cytidylyltransferase [Bacteroidaceae bacterium]
MTISHTTKRCTPEDNPNLKVMVKSVAVVLAAGSGKRTGLDIPKQFLMLGGKTVLEHSVQTFNDHSGIDEVVVVTSAQYIDRVHEMGRANGWSKLAHVIPGGKERYDSSLAAVRQYVGTPDSIMLFHDAARPLVSERVITDCLEAMQTYNCVDVAIPAVDTIVQCDRQGTCMESIQDRSLLWQMQTPQCFRQKTIQEAYRIALSDPGFTATDDCGTVLRYLPSEKVGIVRGDASLMKLTYAQDLTLLEHYLHR